jgi:hypothetical protein
MTKYSKRSRKIFSAQTEEVIKGLIVRAEKFRTEADAILSKYEPPAIVEEANQKVENIFRKFHSIVVEINRRYSHRDTLQVKDEYDVQDLLRGLLRIHFSDIRKEEWTPSYAGGSKRIDFLLRNEQIAIETKMTRERLTAREVGDELIIDIAHYRRHPDCQTLYCFVYDPDDRLLNPRGLEIDLTRKHEKLDVKVIIMPKRD